MFAVAILILSSYSVKSQSVAATNENSIPNIPAGALVVPDDYPTIQAAIGNASAGDTVYVKKGTYSYIGGGDNAILIDKPLSLIGEDSQKTVITRTEGYIRYTYNVISIIADNVTVSGFTIIGNRGLVGIRIEGIHSQPSGIKIIGNNIASSLWGIATYGGENYIISQNNLTENDYAISFESSNSVISGNNITENHLYGLNIGSCQNVNAKENNISGNGLNASNHDEGDVGGLIFWIGANNVYVYENNITDNRFGVRFSRSCNNSEVYNNNIMRNGLGINLFNSASGGLGNKVYYNNIIDNTQNANVQNNGAGVVLWDNGYVGNYWSDYKSKYPNATEVDASAIGNTQYIIDENNTDHYPLMRQVDISSTAPPTASISASDILVLTIAIIVVVVVLLVSVVSLLFYRKHQKMAN
jgi:nitrous oxidase accessory protein NosD